MNNEKQEKKLLKAIQGYIKENGETGNRNTILFNFGIISDTLELNILQFLNKANKLLSSPLPDDELNTIYNSIKKIKKI